jgi:hypothetical protein
MNKVAFEVVITSDEPTLSDKEEAKILKRMILDVLRSPYHHTVSVMVRVVPLTMDRKVQKDWV